MLATVANGSGSVSDWIGLYAAGAPDAAYLDWKYLDGSKKVLSKGVTAASVPFTLPQTPGTYNLRFFAHNDFTRLASTTITVTRSGAPTVAASSTVAIPGGTVTVTVAGGPANRTDWVGLYQAEAADAAYMDWRYLNGGKTVPLAGVTGATVTFTLPTTPGTYSLRFFANSTFALLGASAPITVRRSSDAPPLTGSTGIGVAIIDSGIAPSADFGGRITGFYDFTNGRVAPRRAV